MNAIILLLLAGAAHHGMYWPAEANGSQKATRALYQAGELEMCMAGEWKYKWTPLSVHVSRLGKKGR